MIERFHRTLKIALRKYISQFGMQWNTYLSGIATSYGPTAVHHTPPLVINHYRLDCCLLTEAVVLPTKPLNPTEVTETTNY